MEFGLAILVFLAWGAAGVLSLYAKYAATIRPGLRMVESRAPLVFSGMVRHSTSIVIVLSSIAIRGFGEKYTLGIEKPRSRQGRSSGPTTAKVRWRLSSAVRT
jgi:hypothetical protein